MTNSLSQYLAELLTPLGHVETSRDVVSEVRQIDVWFVPSGAIAPLLQLPTQELTRLLLTLSREELLEQFGGQSSSRG